MPWPEQVGLLLALPEGRPSQALRWGLHGLRAALRVALEDAASDPGAEELRSLLNELDSLVDGLRAAPGLVLPPDQASAQGSRENEVPAGSPRLLSLARAVASDRRFQAELKRSPIREGSDDEIWGDVQRLLLRVPPALADEWRQRSLQHAEQAGGLPDESPATVVPLPRDEVIYPGLTGSIQASGLRSATAAALDPRVVAPSDGDLPFLAGLTSTCLWFVDHDPALGHCLKSVFRFGVSPLSGDQRERYVAELLRLWERARTSALGPKALPSRRELKESLRAHLDLDEALHCLVHQPLAAPNSWWGRLQNQARDILFQARDRAAQTGYPAHLQLLGGDFAEINRLAPDSLQIDDGVPGEVSACLRVWARIDGEELKGRVLYRSPQEGA